jgi:hypothetical protein
MSSRRYSYGSVDEHVDGRHSEMGTPACMVKYHTV